MSEVSEVRDYILIVVKLKKRSERSLRLPYNNSQVKHRNECSQ